MPESMLNFQEISTPTKYPGLRNFSLPASLAAHHARLTDDAPTERTAYVKRCATVAASNPAYA
jgi:hypothetical protein